MKRWVKVGVLVLEAIAMVAWAVQCYHDRQPAPIRAQCQDLTYSHSRHRPGTCAKHGGVLRWITR